MTTAVTQTGEEVAVDTTAPRPPLVLYDGVCGLCNAWIDFLLARDRAGVFRFAPLQGQTADQILPGGAQQHPESVVLWDGEKFHDRSDAIWRMLVQLPGVWRLAGVGLRCFPRSLRNWGYGFIARRRYRIFGKKETCRMPTPVERSRFLP